MRVKRPILPTLLLFSEIAILYGSLALTLFLRYGLSGFQDALNAHLLPFTVLFLLWIAVFYSAGLYFPRALKNDLAFAKTLFVSLVVSAVIAVIFFYSVPGLGIAPRANLLLFLFIFIPLDTAMRFGANFFSSRRAAVTEAVLFGDDKDMRGAERHLRLHPQLGYLPFLVATKQELSDIIARRKIGLIVLSSDTPRPVVHFLYKTIAQGTRVVKFPMFYETVLQKIPLSGVEEVWLLENIPQIHKTYETVKSAFEVAFASLLFILLSPLMLIIAAAIMLTSRGQAVYAQKRVGLRGKLFTLYKFRTMYRDAETQGPKWAEKNDPRITSVGRFLRFSHLDEIPQLINVILGNLSFIGPRPERPEFAAMLEKKIPYYEIRTLVKPGITGWAQINFRYGSSVEDAYEKLQYDLFYIKNRTVVLDVLILLRTVKMLFSPAQ